MITTCKQSTECRCLNTSLQASLLKLRLDVLSFVNNQPFAPSTQTTMWPSLRHFLLQVRRRCAASSNIISQKSSRHRHRRRLCRPYASTSQNITYLPHLNRHFSEPTTTNGDVVYNFRRFECGMCQQHKSNAGSRLHP